MITTPTHHLGAPTQIGPLTVFPIWTDAPVPRRALRTQLPVDVAIDETAGHSTVDKLVLTNPTSTRYLLTGGSIFSGGWQHRVLVTSTVVAASTTTVLDVRCVEQGRWGGSTSQRVFDRSAPLAVRGALRSDSRDGYGDGHIQVDTHEPRPDRADQGQVWDRVRLYEESFGRTATSSLVDITSQIDSASADHSPRANFATLDIPAPLLGQRGVLIGIGGHPALLEVFDHPHTLADQLHSIINGLVVDAHRVPSRPTPGHRARSFIARVSGRHLDVTDRADRADRSATVEVRDDLVALQGLTTSGRSLVHLSGLNVRHELVGMCA